MILYITLLTVEYLLFQFFLDLFTSCCLGSGMIKTDAVGWFMVAYIVGSEIHDVRYQIVFRNGTSPLSVPQIIYHQGQPLPPLSYQFHITCQSHTAMSRQL